MVTRPKFLARQAGHPRGLLGEVIACAMAYDTARVNQIAIDRLELQATDAVLELGFGHGRTLFQVAGRTREGFVAGVDPSEVMLRHARMRNSRYIDQGRVELHLGESAGIPYPDHRFDKAFAVHVLYFWDDPERDLREIRRVLRPGGRLLLGFRPADDPQSVADLPATVYRLYTRSEVETLLRESGYDAVHCAVENPRGRPIAFATASA